MKENLILFNKPYGVVSQFTGDDRNLSAYGLPPHFYVAGRLDKDSEGLLLLTNAGSLQARISHPRYKMEKTYWTQVEGLPSEATLDRLRKGVQLKDGMTAPAKARVIQPAVLDRDPPIRVRPTIPDQWVELMLTEGKNRQVRRMTAAVGHPTLRLIRVKIGDWALGDLSPGDWRAVSVNLPITPNQKKPKPRR
ncbi:MAG: pseudouridine synthase [Pseudomonadales bacterium]|jgi:23S rRNA pseudouridine2457 synthase